MGTKNKYFLLRHGEALSNVREVVSSWPETFENHLTKNGREQIAAVADELKDKNIDLIFVSPLLRTKETAEIISKELGAEPTFDQRLEEIGFGSFNGKGGDVFLDYFKGQKERIKKSTPGGESYGDVYERVAKFLNDIEEKYNKKNILIVSHQVPLFMAEGHIKEFSLEKIVSNLSNDTALGRGELRQVN